MKKKQLIEKMIRRRGLTKHVVFQKLNITRPTFLKLIEDVNLLNGHQRKTFSSILGIDVTVLDSLINLSERETERSTTEILNLIKPYRDWETDRKSTRLNSSHRL